MMTELFKLKRTLTLAVVVLSPTLPAVMNWGVYRGIRGIGLDWLTFIQNSMAIWSLLLMPFIVTLVTALAVHVEQQTGAWRANLVLPQPRRKLYFEKCSSLMILIGFSQLVAMLTTIISGYLLPHDLQGGLPIGSTIGKFFLAWLACIAMLSISYIIAVRTRTFLVPSAVGATATVIGFVMVIAGGIALWWPWTLPGVMLTDHLGIGELISRTGVSFAVGALVLLIGFWDFARRDF